MAKLSKETKQRLQQVFQCGQFVIRWGFIPTVLYLGFKRGADPGMPEPTVLRLPRPHQTRPVPMGLDHYEGQTVMLSGLVKTYLWYSKYLNVAFTPIGPTDCGERS
ncbi:unnamed protein product [Merluccius merluccius]